MISLVQHDKLIKMTFAPAGRTGGPAVLYQAGYYMAYTEITGKQGCCY